MKKILLFIISGLAVTACGIPGNGRHTLHILTTNDIHGAYFDEPYTGGAPRRSLYAVKGCVDSIRAEAGADNVLLIDAGDCLQGDNASYYFNYVDTLSSHVFPRMAEYMGYDAIAVGNHDVETGHQVYDRIADDLHDAGIAFLGGNAIDTSDSSRYFPLYKVYKRAGLKVLVLGYTNANMKAWLNESLWSGMDFKSLTPLVQEDVDRLREKIHPDVVIVAMHSGTGDGKGGQLESQGLDVFRSVEGIDLLICSHDHQPYTKTEGQSALINAGSRASHVGHGTINVDVRRHKVCGKEVSAELIPVDAKRIDSDMKETFRQDFEAVKAFTMKEVGTLETDLVTRDSYKGMCDYMNLIHTVSLGCEPAQISFAAPLTYDRTIPAGTLIFNDMFTIYPYENQLFVVKMSGKEIKDFLEFSYGMWIRAAMSPSDHVLNIRQGEDARTGRSRWSFAERTYNFDSAAGINYTVDVTKPYGSRVSISSLADGTAFSEGNEYNVAMTSYRASGGGGSMVKGAGIDTGHIDERVVAKYPEIRELIYDYIVKNGTIGSDMIGNKNKLGSWNFIPESIAVPAVEKDFQLLFGRKED